MTTSYGVAALAGCVDRVEQAAKGHRHRTLYAAACEAGRLVAGGELDETRARTALLSIGITAGLLRVEAERQVDRGLAAGANDPKRAPTSGSIALHSATDARARVLDWWEAVSSDPVLRTRRGTTTLRVLAGHALLCMGAGKVRHSDSYRQLAEASGVSLGTVNRHLADVAPYVRPVRPTRRADDDTATVWQLVLRGDGHCGTARRSRGATPPALFPNGHPLDDPAANLWQRRSGWWWCWMALAGEDGATVAELCEASGRQPRTVRRILGTLRAQGLVLREEGRWHRQEAAPVPVVVVDHQEVRKARHVAQRDAWRRHRAALAAAREAERHLPPAARADLRCRRDAARIERRARLYEVRRGQGGQPLTADPPVAPPVFDVVVLLAAAFPGVELAS